MATSIREQIAQYIVDNIKNSRYVKSVTREPKLLSELSAMSYPHVLIESANETRSNSSFGDNIRQEADIDFLINIVVSGADKDSQRNLIIQAIEDELQTDSTFGGLVFDSLVTDVRIREIDQVDPYATAAIVYRVRYYYNRKS